MWHGGPCQRRFLGSSDFPRAAAASDTTTSTVRRLARLSSNPPTFLVNRTSRSPFNTIRVSFAVRLTRQPFFCLPPTSSPSKHVSLGTSCPFAFPGPL